MRLIELDWIDSSSTHGWADPIPSHPDTMNIKSIGFLLCEDKSTITMSAHVARNGQSSHSPITIPKVAIIKRRNLGSREWGKI